jgi:hypothetical protein
VGRAKLLTHSVDAKTQAEILVVAGLGTSAIDGEILDVDALRRSSARRLGVELEDGARPAPAGTCFRTPHRTGVRVSPLDA